MIPQQNFENYPVFGDDATKIQPGAAKYAAGFQESDVLPAEWMNWAWNKNSKGITDLNAAAASMEAELGNVVTQAGLTPAANDNTQVMQAIRNFFTGNLSTIYVTSAANVTPAAENVGTITALTDGLSVTVMLKNGYYGDGTNPMRFNLNNLGLKKIYAVKDGAPIIMPSHTIDRGDGNGSKPWYCQPYTTLKLIYDATLEEGAGAWVIEDNPIVLSKSNNTEGYTVYVDGLIEQYTELSAESKFNFKVKFLNTNYNLFYSVNRNSNSIAIISGKDVYVDKSKTYAKVDVAPGVVKTGVTLSYFVKGY